MQKILQARRPATRLWLIPLVYVAVAVLCGTVLPRLEYAFLRAYMHGTSVASAQAALSAIASGMLALTGIVFALAFVMVQFSAAAYSPRLVTWIGRDPVLFHGLGLFIATFLYAISILAWIDRYGSGWVPLFSGISIVAMMVISLMAFARLIQRLSDLQITNVLHVIGRRGREVVGEMFPPREEGGGAAAQSLRKAAEEAGQRPAAQTLRYSGEPCAVTHFQMDALVRHAEEADAVIFMECAVGDTLFDDAPLLQVRGGRQVMDENLLRKAIGLGKERSFEQDPKYPLRLLVDIAIRALSPAINDPTTAVQAIAEIEDLLLRLGRGSLDRGYIADQRGSLRLIFPTPSWEDYLTLSFDEIRQYGARSVQVLRRLRAALVCLLSDSAILAEHKTVVQLYLEHLDHVVEHSILDDLDRAMALREDRQGLGLSRGAPPKSRTNREG